MKAFDRLCPPEAAEALGKGLRRIAHSLDRYGIARFGENHFALRMEVERDDDAILDDIEALCGKDALDLVREWLECEDAEGDAEEDSDDCPLIFVIEVGYGVVPARDGRRIGIVAFCYVDEDARFPIYRFMYGWMVRERLNPSRDIEICSAIAETAVLDPAGAESMMKEFSEKLLGGEPCE